MKKEHYLTSSLLVEKLSVVNYEQSS